MLLSGTRYHRGHARARRSGGLVQKIMTYDVLCLRPEADFQRVNALPPRELRVVYRGPGDADVPALMKAARALVIPAVGPKLPNPWFEGSTVRFVQVTGAGLDRLDLPLLERAGIRV